MLQVLIGSAGAIPDGFLVMENTTTTISQRVNYKFLVVANQIKEILIQASVMKRFLPDYIFIS